MELSKKYRWMKIGFIIMVVLNVGTLATIWIIRPPFPFRHPTERRERVQHFLERELNLTDQQRQTFRELRRQHFQKNQEILNNIHQLRGRYFDLLESPDSTANQAEIDSIATQIGRLQAQMEENMFDYLQRMRKLLSNEQQKKFARVIEQALRRRDRNGPGNQSAPGRRN